MKLEDARDRFILRTKANLRSKKTVKWYEYILSQMVKHFNEFELDQITTMMLQEYIVGLLEQDKRYVDAPQKPPQEGGLSLDTIAGHVRGLHTFWAWVAKEFKFENPMDGIERPRVAKSTPKAITESDFVKLFEATGDNPLGVRDRAILAFLYDTGCRLQGLLSLNSDNLKLDEKRAYLQEKGGDTRVVPYSDYTDMLLRHWLTVRTVQSKHIFTTGEGKPLTMSGLHEIIKRLKRRAGVTGRTNPHSFRHAYAKGYLKDGGDLSTLKELMGHSNIQTTHDSYAVFSDEELVEAHKKHAPLRRIFEQRKKRTRAF
jgi:site-specific recombinase XerD